MACITTMQRYEIKYLLGAREKEAVLQAMSPYMELDEYGRTTIRNVYFDTDSLRLIRRSLEKPAYKEKLRIRSYQPARPDDPVFVELKTDTGKLSALQAVQIRRLGELGQKVYVTYGIDGVSQFFQDEGYKETSKALERRYEL